MMRIVAVLAGISLCAPALAADSAADAAQGYTIEGSATPSAVNVGERGKVAVTIRPKAPTWHVHPQAPLKVRFDAPGGLKLEKPDLGRKDVADPKAEAPRFETPFVATSAGVQQVQAKVDFFICSDTACVKQVKDVSVAVNVK
jgi:hypothetical protein